MLKNGVSRTFWKAATLGFFVYIGILGFVAIFFESVMWFSYGFMEPNTSDVRTSEVLWGFLRLCKFRVKYVDKGTSLESRVWP